MVELLAEQELEQLLSAPEGQILERKSGRIHPRDMATTLAPSPTLTAAGGWAVNGLGERINGTWGVVRRLICYPLICFAEGNPLTT